MDLAINVSDTVTVRERFVIERPWRNRAGHHHKAAVTVKARDDWHCDGGRWTWLEHVWDREGDLHIETRREQLTGQTVFRKRERASTRRPIDEYGDRGCRSDPAA